MFLVMRFPIADLRILVDEAKGVKVKKPHWPSPDDKSFVRFFGKIRTRPRGGPPLLGGEGKLCVAKRAIRFCNSPVFKFNSTKFKIVFKTSRNFYFDGYLIGKFEIGISNQKSVANTTLKLNELETKNLTHYFLNLDVRIPNPQESSGIDECKLYQMDKRLSKLYFKASTRYKTKIKYEDWWVRPGVPALYLECGDMEDIQIPKWFEKEHYTKYGLQLSCGPFRHVGREFRMFILKQNAGYNHERARNLRLYLLRLYSQHECLRVLFNNIEAESIDAEARINSSKNSKKYFKKLAEKIERIESSALEGFGKEFLEIARKSIEGISKDDYKLVIENIKTFDHKRKVPTRSNLIINSKEGVITMDNYKIKRYKEVTEPNESSKEYDVVLSFAGEDRSTAEELAGILKSKNVEVFYDDNEEAKLWGKDLYEHLAWVYKDAAKYCIMFISEHYKKKLWTSHERKSAQARAFEEKREYILPLRLDDTEIPGIPNTIAYIDMREESCEEVAELIIQKLKQFGPH